MIHVWINKSQFEYDIHSLVKAFYPGEEVKVRVAGEGEVPGAAKTAAEDGRADDCQRKTKDAEKLTDIYIDFDENEIAVWLGEKIAGKAVRREFSPDSGRPEIKNVLKQLLYQALSENLGRRLPWGTLTGIRPTKIPMGWLEEGRSEEEILADMERKYYISPEKGRLSIDIAKREKELLSVLHYKDGYSLYIGIPFCPTTCLYCSFTSYPIGLWKKRVGDYLDALEKEMAITAKIYRDKILDTVYIGQILRFGSCAGVYGGSRTGRQHYEGKAASTKEA